MARAGALANAAAFDARKVRGLRPRMPEGLPAAQAALSGFRFLPAQQVTLSGFRFLPAQQVTLSGFRPPGVREFQQLRCRRAC